MAEDKLNAGQRLRLECLAQAVASSGAITGRVQTGADILARAKKYEEYVSGPLEADPCAGGRCSDPAMHAEGRPWGQRVRGHDF